MAKKNTLSDLNRFLKHTNEEVKVKADSGDHKEYLSSDPHQITTIDALENQTEMHEREQFIAAQVMQLAEENQQSFAATFNKIIVNILEHRKDLTSAEVMLLNTAMFLDHNEAMIEGYKSMQNKK